MDCKPQGWEERRPSYTKLTLLDLERQIVHCIRFGFGITEGDVAACFCKVNAESVEPRERTLTGILPIYRSEAFVDSLGMVYSRP